MNRALFALSAIACGWLAAIAPAQAQSGKMLHIVVPFAAGGGQDVLARAIANELGAALNETVIIDNKGGAGGALGTAFVANSDPDGETLLLAAASHTINAAIYAKLPYDPIKDFAPAAHIGTSSYVMFANTDVPAKTLAEFVAYAKANPHKLNYASAGNGSATHLAMAYFTNLAGIDMVHVPFKSTGEALTQVMAGWAQALIIPNLGAVGYAADPKLRVLGVTSDRRAAEMPDVPTFAEAGMSDYHFQSWFGLLAPTRTPPDRIARINAAVATILKNPEVDKRLTLQGFEPKAMSSDDFAALVRENLQQFRSIVKNANIVVE